MISTTAVSDQNAVGANGTFDPASGSLLERALFNHRSIVLALCLLVTAVLSFQLPNLRLNASFEKMIPASHPFIRNFMAHRSELAGLGNSVRIAVATTGQSIYDPDYLATLQKISDEVYLLPGVDRAQMKSLWTPSTRWVGVTEDGLEGDPVIPNDYNGSPKSVEQTRINVQRSREIGQLVALDQRSSVVFMPLLEKTPDGKPIDYSVISAKLEEIRNKYQSDRVRIHITGFAKVVGDLIEGLRAIVMFFGIALVITTIVLYAYTRCWRSTALVVTCSLIAVMWQLGLLPLLGYELDPYSVLMPFLVFAIGMSHGAQKMNGIMQDIGRGMRKEVAARFTFRRLFMAGLTALICDAVGFAVLMIIDIRVIQDLAIIASMGVAILIFTNLILLPVLLSYLGVSETGAQRSLQAERAGNAKHPMWRFLDLFTQRKYATLVLGICAMLTVAGFMVSLHLKIGDLDVGAPELRPDSRYNRDNAFMTQNYGASSDVFAVMVKTPDNGCSNYDALSQVDALEWRLAQLPGVETTNSLALLNRQVLVGLTEGSAKWFELLNSQRMLNTITAGAPRGLYNETCNLLTLYTFLSDHRADTLTRVVDEVETFAKESSSPNAKFMLAAGNAGIEAATNAVVKEANREMLIWVYAAVIALCFVTFRSWRAVLCAVVPLIMTSILCEALMVWLNIGVKVATLPVIALGVGIGVDYALYVVSIMLARLRLGESLSQAYYQALLFTGKVVMLTGVTLAIGVLTWALSPIKFQADMGILLAFMFLWNMLGALILVPALACFLSPSTKLSSTKPHPAC